MLHNMSCRPSTQVEWTILPAGESIVYFDLSSVDWTAAATPELQPAANAFSRGGAESMRDLPRDRREEIAWRLDQVWEGWGLTGALHVYPWAAASVVAEAAGLVVLRATHPALVLNVLGRTRSQLLLPTMPLELERPFLERTLAADDPRLIHLAMCTAFVKENG
jgi:hypothetical protein